jgi:S1-C subfamily serine protease
MGLLQHRNFFIDRHSNSLWTRARQVPVPKNDGFTEIGVALVFPPNAGPTVYQVVDGSPAGEAGLSTGYVVTRLSGLPAEEINRYTAERALSKAATDRSPVEILVSKQGRVERLTLLPPAAAKR